MRLIEQFEAIDLILNPIGHTSLQQIGDVCVELAVLMPQGGYRHDHR
jgi:hypothetical protein